MKHDRRDLLGERLDKFNMTAPDHEPNRVDDDVIGEDCPHIVGVTAHAAHFRLDVKHDALRRPMLEIIGADPRHDGEIAHEDMVDLAVAIAPADDASRHQPPVDLRRLWDRPFARDKIPDEARRLRIDRSRAVVTQAERGAESEHVRQDQEQARDIRRLERPGKPAHQTMRAAEAAKFLEARGKKMRKQAPAALVPGVEHGAAEAHLGKLGEDGKVGLPIGEQHADQWNVMRQRPKRRAEPRQDVHVDGELQRPNASGGERARAAQQRCLLVRRIAERRARLRARGDEADGFARGLDRDCAKRAPGRILEVDDVGAGGKNDLRFPRVEDARKHARHAVASLDRASRARRFSLIRGSGAPILTAKRKLPMRFAFRFVMATALAAAVSPAFAKGPPNTDPNWPCHQLKVTAFPLASVWAGPDLDLSSQAWRDQPDVADLANRMSQRRVPIAEVESAIAAFKAKEGPGGKEKLLTAFAAGFEDLVEQRSKVIEGLERFGRRQRELADGVRSENEALQKAVDANHGQPSAEQAELQKRLDWDLRVFDDRRQSISYVCEVPAEIEHRIGALAQAVQNAL